MKSRPLFETLTSVTWKSLLSNTGVSENGVTKENRG
jgi:hypothetical protein